MAKISAHGKILGTVEMMAHSKRYMSDGKILRNDGFGWKLGPKLKAGVSVEDAYRRQVAYQAEWAAKNPSAAAYRVALHDLAPLGGGRRARLHMTVQMMPEDPDGVWSECCDGYGENVHADIDDIVVLCRLYRAAIAEKAEQADPTMGGRLTVDPAA